jgi:hypothetical protein
MSPQPCRSGCLWLLLAVRGNLCHWNLLLPDFGIAVLRKTWTRNGISVSAYSWADPSLDLTDFGKVGPAATPQRPGRTCSFTPLFLTWS